MCVCVRKIWWGDISMSGVRVCALSQSVSCKLRRYSHWFTRKYGPLLPVYTQLFFQTPKHLRWYIKILFFSSSISSFGFLRGYHHVGGRGFTFSMTKSFILKERLMTNFASIKRLFRSCKQHALLADVYSARNEVNRACTSCI